MRAQRKCGANLEESAWANDLKRFLAASYGFLSGFSTKRGTGLLPASPFVLFAPAWILICLANWT